LGREIAGAVTVGLACRLMEIEAAIQEAINALSFSVTEEQ
jgi:hypothetical protein